MDEILPGIFHWTTFHKDIEHDVDSYYFNATTPPLLIDPMLPAKGVV